ncbi:aminoglycoside phosphotransferase family protein [Actinoplanes sp. NBC_00393]|uniref:phosphotransferase family protein n=1 Tax=Actinoplanes sp. NBC_00393 TaxID=2975953 RepID=UPI002E22D8BD
MGGALGKLSEEQRRLLDEWIPGAAVEQDHSWGVVETTVLEMARAGSRFIVKAGGAADHHIEREIRAHLHWLEPWTSLGRAPLLLHHDSRAKLIVTTYLPGELVLDAEQVGDPGAYRQAGELLALLHAHTSQADDDYERRENQKSLKLLAGPHRIAGTTVERLQRMIAAWPTPPVTVVPTHGDWQPRNWLIHDGVVSIIDFGRAALRPPFTDLNRLDAQEFRTGPQLEAAFMAGYGSDPRAADGWHRSRMREAIATACWAYAQGIEEFEAQGHRMIAEASEAFIGRTR